MAINNVLPEERVPLLKKLIKDNKITLVGLDIESSLCKAFVWGTGEQYVGEKQLLEPTRIIMAQYVFEGNNTPQLITWDKEQNDKQVIEKLNLEVFNKSNLIVVGQNQKSFDLKIINDRCVTHSLKPIPFQKIIQMDTLSMSRASFRRHSHGLDSRSKAYGFGGKIPTTYELWIRVYNGDLAALNEMARYGLKDPVDTLGVFWRELPYYTKLDSRVEKLLRDAKGDAQLMCRECEKRRQGKFNVIRVNHNLKPSDNGKHALCKKCSNTWRLEE